MMWVVALCRINWCFRKKCNRINFWTVSFKIMAYINSFIIFVLPVKSPCLAFYIFPLICVVFSDAPFDHRYGLLWFKKLNYRPCIYFLFNETSFQMVLQPAGSSFPLSRTVVSSMSHHFQELKVKNVPSFNWCDFCCLETEWWKRGWDKQKNIGNENKGCSVQVLRDSSGK